MQTNEKTNLIEYFKGIYNGTYETLKNQNDKRFNEEFLPSINDEETKDVLSQVKAFINLNFDEKQKNIFSGSFLVYFYHQKEFDDLKKLKDFIYKFFEFQEIAIKKNDLCEIFNCEADAFLVNALLKT
jgi:hypothetical protein